jgi:hypothetical protein
MKKKSSFKKANHSARRSYRAISTPTPQVRESSPAYGRMSRAEIQTVLIQESSKLPASALEEVLDFVQFIQRKFSRQSERDSISKTLSLLDAHEKTHLEEEFKDYKELYPREE